MFHYQGFTQQTYRVRLDEVDSRHRLTVNAFIGFLQEIAWQASVEGQVPIPTLLNQGLTWVLSRFQLEVKEYPVYEDNIFIETYAPFADKFSIQRDFKIYVNEKLIAQAISNWLVVEVEKKKIAPIPDFILQALLNPEKPKLEMNKAKIPELQAPDYQYDIEVRWHDLDINQHTNNKHYFRWALDALPADWLSQRQLQWLDFNFRTESVLNEKLTVKAEKKSETEVLHQIIRQSSDKEVIRGSSLWL
jgi:acyl-ACP thioesterase